MPQLLFRGYLARFESVTGTLALLQNKVVVCRVLMKALVHGYELF